MALENRFIEVVARFFANFLVSDSRRLFSAGGCTYTICT